MICLLWLFRFSVLVTFLRHGLYIQGWPQIYYVVESDLEFLISFCLYFLNSVIMGVFNIMPTLLSVFLELHVREPGLGLICKSHKKGGFVSIKIHRNQSMGTIFM